MADLSWWTYTSSPEASIQVIVLACGLALSFVTGALTVALILMLSGRHGLDRRRHWRNTNS